MTPLVLKTIVFALAFAVFLVFVTDLILPLSSSSGSFLNYVKVCSFVTKATYLMSLSTDNLSSATTEYSLLLLAGLSINQVPQSKCLHLLGSLPTAIIDVDPVIY